MIVKFHSSASADLTLFGEVATDMLKIMGHSGTIPGAFQSQDLPNALAKLEKAVAASKADDAVQVPDEEFKPGLSQRALPVINLLKKAIEANADVMWDER